MPDQNHESPGSGGPKPETTADPPATPDSQLARLAQDRELDADTAEAVARAAEAAAEAARTRAVAMLLRRREASGDAVAVPESTAEQVGDDRGDAMDASVEVGEDRPVDRPRRPSLRMRPRRRAVIVSAAVAVLLAAGITIGYSMWNHQEITEKGRHAAEFTAAARQGVVALTSLDFSRAEQDVQRILDNSTGTFRDDFQGRAKDFTTVIQQSQVATEGKVNTAAVESISPDSAVVLVAATSQVTNSAGAKQEPRAWRLSVTMSRDGDQIKMSKVEFVP